MRATETNGIAKLTKTTLVPVGLLISAIILSCTLTHYVDGREANLGTRLSVLERRVEDVSAKLNDVSDDVGQVKIDVATIKARVINGLGFKEALSNESEKETEKDFFGAGDNNMSGATGDNGLPYRYRCGNRPVNYTGGP